MTFTRSLCEVNIYKQQARHSNNNQYFEWIESERIQTEKTGVGLHNFYWEYETPTMRFKIRLKERSDLKVWKYEIHVSATKVYFENFQYIKMHQRSSRNGWSMGWTNFLLNHYSENELKQKFKTFEEAILKVADWKKDLKRKFSYEINYDKTMYTQACDKYINTINIELNYESANTFYSEITKYEQLEIVKDDYWHVEVSGENAKEIVQNIINEYRLSCAILAG
ncbi:hypothetical protein HV417_18155 [Bacillus sporothermodurans]|uniref:hypothetical protein n=1 Tax=Heyndrickxia sporothermodurans TaxID=46224 RepID=UPI00192B80CA|nr:hypothetical protein [Heyndrickxia sporothermodurans]MBL5875360.1 hypothetical protein [Heyndrickxia sporothermodurans]